jgi:hypothetical protein
MSICFLALVFSHSGTPKLLPFFPAGSALLRAHTALSAAAGDPDLAIKAKRCGLFPGTAECMLNTVKQFGMQLFGTALPQRTAYMQGCSSMLLLCSSA